MSGNVLFLNSLTDPQCRLMYVMFLLFLSGMQPTVVSHRVSKSKLITTVISNLFIALYTVVSAGVQIPSFLVGGSFLYYPVAILQPAERERKKAIQFPYSKQNSDIMQITDKTLSYIIRNSSSCESLSVSTVWQPAHHQMGSTY